jgi:hypothetical protein
MKWLKLAFIRAKLWNNHLKARLLRDELMFLDEDEAIMPAKRRLWHGELARLRSQETALKAEAAWLTTGALKSDDARP